MDGERVDFTDEDSARIIPSVERRYRATAPASAAAPRENAPVPLTSIVGLGKGSASAHALAVARTGSDQTGAGGGARGRGRHGRRSGKRCDDGRSRNQQQGHPHQMDPGQQQQQPPTTQQSPEWQQQQQRYPQSHQRGLRHQQLNPEASWERPPPHQQLNTRLSSDRSLAEQQYWSGPPHQWRRHRGGDQSHEDQSHWQRRMCQRNGEDEHVPAECRAITPAQVPQNRLYAAPFVSVAYAAQDSTRPPFAWTSYDDDVRGRNQQQVHLQQMHPGQHQHQLPTSQQSPEWQQQQQQRYTQSHQRGWRHQQFSPEANWERPPPVQQSHTRVSSERSLAEPQYRSGPPHQRRRHQGEDQSHGDESHWQRRLCQSNDEDEYVPAECRAITPAQVPPYRLHAASFLSVVYAAQGGTRPPFPWTSYDSFGHSTASSYRPPPPHHRILHLPPRLAPTSPYTASSISDIDGPSTASSYGAPPPHHSVSLPPPMLAPISPYSASSISDIDGHSTASSYRPPARSDGLPPLAPPPGFFRSFSSGQSQDLRSLNAALGSMEETDRKILVKLYQFTKRTNWHQPRGRGFSVTTNDEGRVVVLGVPDNNLQGTIPSELGGLSVLKTLDLSGNQLRGTIPSELGGLSALKTLGLIGNQLSGTIPSKLGGLSALETLNLSGNQLSGTIPSELGGLSALETLHLFKNQLSGTIPSELGGLSALETLDLGRNQLSGTIPSELGGLSVLKTLDLSGNQLSGTIPSELGGLSALKTLDLIGNQLSGTIPSELGGLSALETLHLSNNELSGTIPSELGGLSALETLHLSNNELSGTIPSELGGLSVLKTLDLSGNQLSGTIPSELGELSALKTLDLGGNQLSGTIPSELGGLSALETLHLSNNELSIMATKTLNLGRSNLNDLGDVQHALELVSKSDFGIRDHTNMELYLRGNPWKMPPEAVVEQGLKAIKIFLGDVQKASENGAQVRSLKLLKVVLVGAASAGKTSLMRSIIEGASSPTAGTLEETSTVGIDLRHHLLQGTKVEFYDCAGQVDYAGMHQTFLTRRALYLLVWDVKLFRGLDERKLLEIVYNNVMRWLYTLHLRAPGATVILVANKCDGSLSAFAETTGRVEGLVNRLLKEWQSRRKSSRRNSGNMTVVKLLDGVSRTSCGDYGGIDMLIDRISGHGATSIQVPPSWDLALNVVDTVRAGGDPLQTARAHLGLMETKATNEQVINTLTTKNQLLKMWEGIVRQVSEKLHSTKDKAAVSNVESALNGALWISEFAGQILRIDRDESIFFDVVWLSNVLSPILSHKLHAEDFPTIDLKRQRDILLRRGVLLWDFAQYLWRDVLGSVEQGSKRRLELIGSLFRVLLKLGVILPLGRPAFFSDRSGSHASHVSGKSKDMLVIMRLPEECSDDQRRAIDSSIVNVCRDCREVKLKWEFDAAKAPYGLVERLISSCHVIGEVEQDLCWRYGALFTSPAMAWGDNRQVRLYKFLISYDNRMLSLRMIGPLSDDRVMAALRYVASAMVVLSMEWPGVQWEGWLDCPNHPQARIYLTPPGEAKIGGQLLDRGAYAHSMMCDCRRKANGVLKLVHQHLGTVVDTRSFVPEV